MSDPSNELFQNYQRHYKDSGAGRWQVPYDEVKALHLDRFPRWLDRIPKEACILDAGCATGYLLTLFWSSGYRNLVGVELSEQLAKIARQSLSNEVEVVVADINEYLKDVPNESFDLILFHHVLEHIPREQTIPLLREFHRVLNPGGYLSLKVPNASYLLAGHQMFGDFTHVVHFNEHSMPQVLEAAGFRKDRIEFVQRQPLLYWSWKHPSHALLRALNRVRWHLHGMLHRLLCLLIDQHPIPKVFGAELETLVQR
jgi:SAM-dependent methyltransferase